MLHDGWKSAREKRYSEKWGEGKKECRECHTGGALFFIPEVVIGVVVAVVVVVVVVETGGDFFKFNRKKCRR